MPALIMITGTKVVMLTREQHSEVTTLATADGLIPTVWAVGAV